MASVRFPMYPEELVLPMREELTSIGFQELRSTAEVDSVLGQKNGTVLVAVNSVCGCAAGTARPGIALAMKHNVVPDKLTTVFAGMDFEAVDRARNYIKGYPPSSPSVALFKDGKLAYMMERHQIEGYSPQEIAANLVSAFEKYCR